jgi:CRISPR system Cascade subunit CasA
MRGGGPLTTLVDPRIDPASEPLWKLLWFNAETREQWRNRVDIDSPEGDSLRYAWLAPTQTSEKGQLPVTPQDADPLQAYFGMPRRLRLVFGDQPARCALTGLVDDRPVIGVRSRNYGVNYAGWVHPLSPYYPLPSGERSAVHPQPSGFQWRDWVDFTLQRADAKRQPAAVVVAAQKRLRAIGVDESRLLVFGYDCDNAKARGWQQVSPPFFRGDATERQWLATLAEELGAAVDAAGFALANAIVTALYGERKDAPRVGDPYRQRLWAITEPLFFAALSDARKAGLRIETVSEARRSFYAPMCKAVRELFEEAAPVSSMNVMGVRRIAQASHYLEGTLAGYGKTGVAMYSALNLTPPEVPKGRSKNTAGKGAAQ